LQTGASVVAHRDVGGEVGAVGGVLHSLGGFALGDSSGLLGGLLGCHCLRFLSDGLMVVLWCYLLRFLTLATLYGRAPNNSSGNSMPDSVSASRSLTKAL